jgi:hypothetical protein
MRKENQIITTQINNPIQKLSMQAKTKTNQKSFSMQMKIVLLDQQVQEKHQKLNFQSITDSEPTRHIQLQ